MMWNRRRQSGFTIVELLIVIVVIAILAAITIVAYNGIVVRANNTQTVDAAKQFVKAYHLYALDNGDYPTGAGCLGEGYPGNRCLNQGAGAPCFGLGSGSDAGINTALKPYMNNRVPTPSMQKIACGGVTYVGVYGYYTSATKIVTIIMILNGDQTCPPMSPNASAPSKTLTESAVRCSYVLAAA